MTEHELIESIESLSFNPADFSHETHIRFAWALLTIDPGGASDRIRIGIQRLAIHAGAPNKYRDDLTLDWIERITERLKPSETWNEFRARETDLFSRSDSSKESRAGAEPCS